MDKIHTLHPILLKELAKHKKRLDEALPSEKREEAEKPEAEFLDMLASALQMEDYGVADFLIEKIKQKQYSEQLQSLVETLADQIFNMQSQDALNTIEKIKK